MRKKFWAVCMVFAASLPAPRAQAAAPDQQVLYPELFINGQDRGGVIELIDAGGQILANPAALLRAGFQCAAWPRNAGGLIVLGAIPKLRLHVDMPTQSAYFEVPPEDLAPGTVTLNSGPGIAAASPAATGAYASYDLTAERGDDTTLNGTVSLNLFSQAGEMRAESEVNLGQRFAGNTPRFARLQTAYEYDWPAVPRSLILGDFIAGSLPWTRPVIMGGIQLETNYELEPGTITFPTPLVRGELAAPSAVDLLVNNVRDYQGNQDAGPFSMVNIPVLTGLNEITVQTRAANGQIVSNTVPFYAAADMLQPGLSEYALNVGMLRHNYGFAGDGYSVLAGSATLREGLDDNLTAALHAEGGGGVTMAGATVSVTSVLGEMSASAAASNHRGATVPLFAVNWTRSGGAIQFSGGATYAHDGFTDLGSFLGVAYPHLSWYASASTQLPVGTVSIAYTDRALYARNNSGFWVGSYNIWSHGVTAAASVFYGRGSDLGRRSRDEGVDLLFSIPLGGRVRAAAGTQSVNGEKTESGVTLARSIDPDGGYGWRVSRQQGDYDNIQAGGQWFSNAGDFSLNLQRINGSDAGQFNAAGSVILLDGLHLTAPAEQGFALVKVGYPNVSVFRENRYAGATGADGNLLVTELVPYLKNQISIDPSQLPLTAALKSADIIVAPPRNGGVIGRFPITISRQMVVVITLPNGEFPPPGSVLEPEYGAASVIGYEGQAALQNPGPAISGKVVMAKSTCRVQGALPAASGPQPVKLPCV